MMLVLVLVVVADGPRNDDVGAGFFCGPATSVPTRAYGDGWVSHGLCVMMIWDADGPPLCPFPPGPLSPSLSRNPPTYLPTYLPTYIDCEPCHHAAASQ